MGAGLPGRRCSRSWQARARPAAMAAEETAALVLLLRLRRSPIRTAESGGIYPDSVRTGVAALGAIVARPRRRAHRSWHLGPRDRPPGTRSGSRAQSPGDARFAGGSSHLANHWLRKRARSRVPHARRAERPPRETALLSAA